MIRSRTPRIWVTERQFRRGSRHIRSLYVLRVFFICYPIVNCADLVRLGIDANGWSGSDFLVVMETSAYIFFARLGFTEIRGCEVPRQFL